MQFPLASSRDVAMMPAWRPVMLGFSLLHCDASVIELLHAQSGMAFTFPLTDGKPTEKCFFAPDLSGDFPSRINVDDLASVESLAAIARMAAGLHLPTEHVRPPASQQKLALPAPLPSIPPPPLPTLWVQLDRRKKSRRNDAVGS
jgi:hypothetical protein